MASAEREPITEVWGQSPQGVQGQSPWSGDLKLKAFELSNIHRKRQNCLVITAPAYARAVLGVVIVSVRPSVCPSVCHTRGL